MFCVVRRETDNTPHDAKQKQDDIKKEGAMDGNVLPLDPCRGNRPHWLRWRKMETRFNNQVWLLCSCTEPDFCFTFTLRVVVFLFFRLLLTRSHPHKLILHKSNSSQVEVKEASNWNPYLPASTLCHHTFFFFFLTKGLPVAPTCQVPPPLRGWQLTWANWRC